MRAHSGVNMKGLHSRGNRDVVAWLVDEAAVFYLQLQVRFLKRTSSSEPPKQISPNFNTSAVANKKIGNLLLTCYHMRCCGGNLLQKNNMTHPCQREAWQCARQWKRNYRRGMPGNHFPADAHSRVGQNIHSTLHVVKTCIKTSNRGIRVLNVLYCIIYHLKSSWFRVLFLTYNRIIGLFEWM